MRCTPILLAALITSGVANGQTLCVNGFAGPFPCNNIDLRGSLSLTGLGTNTSVADLWGWTDPLTGKEYALVGCRTGTAFVDLSVPTDVKLVGFLLAHNNTTSAWRDVDTHGNWCKVAAMPNTLDLAPACLTLRRPFSP